MDSRGRRIQRRKNLSKFTDDRVEPGTNALVATSDHSHGGDVSGTLLTAFVVLLILGVSGYLITHGTGSFRPDDFAFVHFYDYQAASLLQGRWDVPIEAVSGEAFLRDGKQYGYFGAAPAVPRIMLNFLWPAQFGKWSRISMMVGVVSLIPAFFVLCALIEVPSSLRPLLLLILFGGSTLAYLCASELIFHEAILWGASLAIWAYILFALYLKTPYFHYLLLGVVCAAGAFFSRVSSGSGAILCAIALATCLFFRALTPKFGWATRALDWLAFPQPWRPILHAAFLTLFVIATGTAFVTINRAKFGTYFDPAPVRFHVQYSAERLGRIHGTLSHPEFLVFNFANYFDPRHIRIGSKFPYLGLSWGTENSTIQMDQVEPYAAFPAAMPAVLILSTIGVAGVFLRSPPSQRRYLIILVPALVAGLEMFTLANLAFRYQHDWFPYFFITAALGAARIKQISARPVYKGVVVLLCIGLLWSIGAQTGFIADLRRSPMTSW